MDFSMLQDAPGTAILYEAGLSPWPMAIVATAVCNAARGGISGEDRGGSLV
jgi:hypothetical protein